MMSPTRVVAAALCVYLSAMPLLGSAQSLTRPAIPTPLTTSLPSLVAQIPSCAITCLKSAASSVNCPPEDFTCLCKQGESLAASLGGCILLGSCSSEDKTKASGIAPQICIVANNNPDPAAVASASRILTSAFGPTSTKSLGTAARQTGLALGSVGMVGAAAALAALAV